MKSKNRESISNVVAVILMFSVTLLLVAILATVAFDFSGDIEKTTVAGVSLDNGELRVNSMGSTEKLLVKRNDNTTFELTSTGETQKVIGGEKIIAIGEDGSRTLLRKVTKQQVIKSGGDIYKDPPENINSNDFQLVSKGFNEGELTKISNPDDRFVTATESFYVKVNGRYDPNDFTYDWKKETNRYDCGSYTNCVEIINENSNNVTYKYKETESDTNAIRVVISTDEDSVELQKSIDIVNPIQNVNIVSEGFKGKDLENITVSSNIDRYPSLRERFKIESITLHPSIEEVASSTDPSYLDYTWRNEGYDLYCGGDFDSCSEVLGDGTGTSNSYKYLRKGSHTTNSPVRVSASLPYLSSKEIYLYSNFDIVSPIKSLTLISQGGEYPNGTEINYSRNDDRILDTKEEFKVESIDLHSNIEEVASSTDPSYLDYTWRNEFSNNYCGGRFDSCSEVLGDGTGTSNSYKYINTGSSSYNSPVRVSASHPALDSQSSNFEYSSFDIINP